jgi:predicted metalloendopeptidase
MITKKIGYPDKWKDYSNVQIVRDSYFENVVSAAAADISTSIGRWVRLLIKPNGLQPSNSYGV